MFDFDFLCGYYWDERERLREREKGRGDSETTRGRGETGLGWGWWEEGWGWRRWREETEREWRRWGEGEVMGMVRGWGRRGDGECEGRECNTQGGKARWQGDGEVSSTRAFLPFKWGGSHRPFPLAWEGVEEEHENERGGGGVSETLQMRTRTSRTEHVMFNLSAWHRSKYDFEKFWGWNAPVRPEFPTQLVSLQLCKFASYPWK